MPDAADPRATLARIDETRAALIALLRGSDSSQLADAASSGDWSPIENVRHLLFAEQLHFSRLIDWQGWNPMGLAPHFLAGEPPFRSVGSSPTTSLDDVLAAWDAVHETVRKKCAEPSAALDQALHGNLSHLQRHLAVIQSLLNP